MTKTQTTSQLLDIIRQRLAESTEKWGDGAWSHMWAGYDMSDVIDTDRQDELDEAAAYTLFLANGTDVPAATVLWPTVTERD